MSEAYLICPKCKKKYHQKAGDDCPNCGTNIPDYQRKQTDRQQTRKKLAKINKAGKNAIAAFVDGTKTNYCLQCGSKFANPKTKTRGSLIIEIFLWLMLLVPGLLYSLWRITSRYKGCPICGSAQIIPTNSPAAQAALNSRR